MSKSARFDRLGVAIAPALSPTKLDFPVSLIRVCKLPEKVHVVQKCSPRCTSDLHLTDRP